MRVLSRRHSGVDSNAVPVSSIVYTPRAVDTALQCTPHSSAHRTAHPACNTPRQHSTAPTQDTHMHASVAEHSSTPLEYITTAQLCSPCVLCSARDFLGCPPCAPSPPVPSLSPRRPSPRRTSAATRLRAASAAISGGAPGRVHVDTTEQGCVCIV